VASLKKERVVPPRQARSRRTLERILAAAERLLADRDFEDLTMADLAAAAGCAVGTLYDRIPSKEALLDCLYDLYAAQESALVERLEASPPELSLRERIELVVDGLLAQYRDHAGLCGAIVNHLYRSEGANSAAFRRANTAFYRRLARFLVASPGSVRHEDGLDACFIGIGAVSTFALNRTVIGQRAGVRRPVPYGKMRRELARMLGAYLESEGKGVGTPAPRSSSARSSSPSHSRPCHGAQVTASAFVVLKPKPRGPRGSRYQAWKFQVEPGVIAWLHAWATMPGPSTKAPRVSGGLHREPERSDA
jgi:AcrR family transcriptional regulator